MPRNLRADLQLSFDPVKIHRDENGAVNIFSSKPVKTSVISCSCIFLLFFFYITAINDTSNDNTDSNNIINSNNFITGTPVVILDSVYAGYCESAKKLPKFSEQTIPLPKLCEPANQRSKELKDSPKVIEQDKIVIHHGIEFCLTLFRPPGSQNQTLPVVVFYHEDGWVFGSKHSHVKPVRDVSSLYGYL